MLSIKLKSHLKKMNTKYSLFSILTIGILIIGFQNYTKSETYTLHPATAADSAEHDRADTQLVDHHVHIFSPRDRKYLVNAVASLDTLPPIEIEQYMKAMDQGNVEKAAILSSAYFFSPEGKPTEKDYAAVKSDNDWVAQSISDYPEKFAGFFSVNPLSDSALVEMDRNAGKEQLSGLKLQLANSAVDLRNSAHVKRLAEVFQKANSLGLGIVVHLRTSNKNYGKKDAQIFIDEILSEAPEVPVQIAHLAGWGGYDKPTDEALGVFAERIANNNLGSNIYFDISAVVRPVSSAATSNGADWYPEQRYARLTKQLRKIGLDRILFGTDWPDWTPGKYKSDLEKNLPLTQAEFQTMYANRAPWFE